MKRKKKEGGREASTGERREAAVRWEGRGVSKVSTRNSDAHFRCTMFVLHRYSELAARSKHGGRLKREESARGHIGRSLARSLSQPPSHAIGGALQSVGFGEKAKGGRSVGRRGRERAASPRALTCRPFILANGRSQLATEKKRGRGTLVGWSVGEISTAGPE